MPTNNTRISDLEPVDMSYTAGGKDTDLYNQVRDGKMVEIVRNNSGTLTNMRVNILQIKNAIIDQMYPVGTIYHTTEPGNPFYKFGYGTWRLYGHPYGENSLYGAPAALFGYDSSNPNFSVSETIRGIDSSAITNGYININKHWGWRRLLISNFIKHTHEVKSDNAKSEWVRKKSTTSAAVVQPASGGSPYSVPTSQKEVEYEKVTSLDLETRHGYGILSSLSPVTKDYYDHQSPSVRQSSILIQKRDLGTTTTNITTDPRVDTVKIGGKNVTVDPKDCQFVTYNNTQYIYATVAQMKDKKKDGTWDFSKGTTNVNKWLKKQNINSAGKPTGTYLGEVPIPNMKETSSSALRYPNYNPVANVVTAKKNGHECVRVKNGSGYTDVTSFSVGDYVSYVDEDKNTITLIYSNDMDVREKTENGKKTITVTNVNKWIPLHDVWQNRYWGRTSTDITSSSGKKNPKITLTEVANSTDITGGYYGTSTSGPAITWKPEIESKLADKVDNVTNTVTAHAGDLVAYSNREYIFNPVTKTQVIINSDGITTASYVKEITQNEWAPEDSGVTAMTKDIPDVIDVGQDYPTHMVIPEPERTGFSKVTVGKQDGETKWSTGQTLRLVDSAAVPHITTTKKADYCVALWPQQILNWPAEATTVVYDLLDQIDNADPLEVPYLIELLHTTIASICSHTPRYGVTEKTKTEYYPEHPRANDEPGTVHEDDSDIKEWNAHNVDNWNQLKNTNNYKDTESHGANIGTIVNTLPPYVTVYRWVRIA